MTFEHLLTKAKLHLNTDKPFVLYRKPLAEHITAIFQKTKALHYTKTYTEEGFVFAPFNTELPSILFPLEQSKRYFVYNTTKDTSAATTPNNIIHTTEKDTLEHIRLIEKGVEEITQGNLKKVVLSRVVNAKTEKQALQLFTALLHTYSNACVYIWFHPKVGLWLGATPEKLLITKGLQFRTMSLAGTKVYKPNAKVNWNLKEKDEQQIVTHTIVDALQSESVTVHATNPETVKAGSLLHLQSIISGRFTTAFSLKNVINVLHPTPAVCGFPKQEAKTFILNNEGYERLFYTGFFGEINFKDSLSKKSLKNIEHSAYRRQQNITTLYVNLRCMSYNKGNCNIYVGGGITAASQPRDEFLETQHKSKTILSVL